MLIHPNFDPVAVSLGSIKIHWYGIMYMLAFATAWFISLRLSKRPWSVLQAKQVEDLIVYGALGVILGGRVGYIVFYNFESWMNDLTLIFRVWEGGMSFHGGMLGVILALFFYSRKIGTSFFGILDFAAVITPLGLGFGRLGNFIGQELWGRTTDVPWGMIFPRDPERLVRHPSQLYQAFLEGLVLFLILYAFSRKERPLLATGALFVGCYGVFRFIVEFFRQPDAHIPELVFGWMTRGQMLTVPMIVIGFGTVIWAYKNAEKNREYLAALATAQKEKEARDEKKPDASKKQGKKKKSKKKH